jgi:tetratricopeptide (TPR) repeat protein
LDRALTHALTAGARRVQSETLVWLLIVYVMGPMPADEGIQRCEAALRSSDNPKVRAYALIERGVLTAMQGRIDAGRHDVAEGRALLREVGLDVWAAITSVESTMVELLADNAAGAKHGLVAARETLERMGEQGFASSILWALADVACFEGDHHDALRLSDQTAAMSSAEDPNAQVSWRRVKAMSLAHLGELDEAERLAREAVNVAYATDLPIHRGDANLALGAVFACSGRTDEAAATYRRAEHEFLLKGDLVTAAKARALAAGGATAT